MQMNSHISAAALAAALLATPQLTLAQGLDLGINIGGESGLDIGAGIGLSRESGLDIGADVGLGGSSDNLVDVDVGVGGNDSSSGGSLVDVDLGVARSNSGASTTGPNGGRLINLNTDVLNTDVLDTEVLDARVGTGNGGGLNANVDLLGGSGGSGGTSLINGDIRIGALDRGARGEAMTALIDNPNLADIDLDARIDERRVSILAAADLFDEAALADIELAVNEGGEGRSQLLEALSASVELGAILGRNGIDPSDVLAIQIAENGAAEVIVLDDTVRVAALGDDGNLADLTVGELADLDIDLLSDEELAEVNLGLLPGDARTTAVLRLLERGDAPEPGAIPGGDLVTIDLDALGDDALARVDAALATGGDNLAELTADIDLLDRLEEAGIAPEAVVAVRLGAEDDLLVFVEAGLDDTLTASIGIGGGATGGTDDGDDGSTSGGDDGAGGGDDGTDSGGGNGGDGDTGGGGVINPGTGGGTGNGNGGGTGSGTTIGALPATQVGAGFTVATLACDVGVLALANGVSADMGDIADAQSLELVRLEGCERTLLDADIDAIRGAIAANAAISATLDDASIPLDQVIGATVTGDTLTVFLDRSNA
jgi:hypothetical protein